VVGEVSDGPSPTAASKLDTIVAGRIKGTGVGAGVTLRASG
jgi:hypothetical protein